MLEDPLLILRGLVWHVNDLQLRYAVAKLIDYIEDDVLSSDEDDMERSNLSDWDLLEILVQGMLTMSVNLGPDDPLASVGDAPEVRQYTADEIEEIVNGAKKRIYGDQEKED